MFETLRRTRTAERLPGITGVARVDRRTKRMVGRLRPGDIAVIDHVDLDRVAAEALVEAGVGAVINAAPSVSGRYPNLGPEILLRAGVPLVDGVGSHVLGAVREGDRVRLDGDTLYDRQGSPVARGEIQTAAGLARAMSDARAGLATQLEAFAANTMEFLRRERALLLDGVGIPNVRTAMESRHVLVVVRGYDYLADLHALRHYIREYRPVLLGVDGGADALIDAGYHPDLIVGDMDSVSDAALRSGAEVVVHAYADGTAPGLARVQDLGIEPVLFPAAGTSEDVAMLLADGHGATLIVAVGTHATLEEFLDKGRSGMASTFLTRLRIGGKLIDAKGVSRLYRSRIPARALVLLIVGALVAFIVALYVTPGGQLYRELFGSDLSHWFRWLKDLF